MNRELTGRHVLIIAVVAFGIVIAANLTMLFSATGTFPGLVVDNAYVASQGWNARRDAQEKLAWQVGVGYQPGLLKISIDDASEIPVRGIPLSATVGRPTTDAFDQTFTPIETPDGYMIPVTLDPGLWRVDLAATGGTDWQINAQIRVNGTN